MTAESRHEFASDNTAAICPAAKRALDEATRASAAAYGDDEWTKRLSERVAEIFECDCAVYLVSNGTAANALALAQICRPFDAIFCHEQAHINVDECGAPEFFTGGAKLNSLPGNNGKVELSQLEAALARLHGVHSHNPRVISVTQATELGTVYTHDELRRISAFAREKGMLVHMDGARFANGLAALHCSPKELSCEVGVDVLCLGGTKNGLAAGELIIFFDKAKAEDFDYRRKQAGQLNSKMRFLAAPWLALFEHDLWLKNASHANFAARELANSLSREGAEIVYPVESNAVFARFDNPTVERLSSDGWFFYKFLEPDIYRLMCSWATTRESISALIAQFKATKSCTTAVP